MGKLTEDELLSIISKYGYDVKEEQDSILVIKRNSKYIVLEHSPLFIGNDRYWQLKRAAAWIMETEKD